MSETPIHNLLTVKETSEYLRIPLPTVYYLVQRGKIPAIQIGGRWRIKKSSLDRDVLHQETPSQPTVLVVDDDPGLQDLFRTFLKTIGFSRVVVGTATEAIKSLRKQKFDLMFLDLQLPDAPGDQVYKTAKQIDPDIPPVESITQIWNAFPKEKPDFIRDRSIRRTFGPQAQGD